MKVLYALSGFAFLILAAASWYMIDSAGKPTIESLDTIRRMETPTTLSLTSTAFTHGGAIPPKYTCDGERELSPALHISGVSEGTVSLALLVDDPDIPAIFKQERGIDSFDHWTLFNIPPETIGIPEGGSAGILGANTTGKNAYTGPCPPAKYEPSEHRYFFRLYALDTKLNLPEGATKAQVSAAMEGHIIARTELVGRYKRR